MKKIPVHDSALALPFLVACALFLGALPVFADHDDGDDYESYEYTLRFNKADLGRFSLFLIAAPENDYDQPLELLETVGDFRFDYAKNVPIIWAVASSKAAQEVKAWLKSKEDPETHKPWFSPELVQELESKFGSALTKLSYTKSKVFETALAAAPCGVHFLKPKGSPFSGVIEKVRTHTEDGDNRGAIVSSGYLVEIQGSPSIELSYQEGESLTPERFRSFLSAEKPLQTNPFQRSAPGASAQSLDPRIWFFGAPILGIALLGIFFLRRRKNAP